MKECVDTKSGCQIWAKNGYCEKRPDFMHVKCKKSCRVCGKFSRSVLPIFQLREGELLRVSLAETKAIKSKYGDFPCNVCERFGITVISPSISCFHGNEFLIGVFFISSSSSRNLYSFSYFESSASLDHDVQNDGVLEHSSLRSSSFFRKEQRASSLYEST